MTLFRREAAEHEARRADAYVESILAAPGRGAVDAPADAELDPELRRTARRLAVELVRVHPSFRFEERLAARLAAAARAGAPEATVAGPGAGRPHGARVIALPVATLDPRPLGPAVVADERTLRDLLCGLSLSLPARPVTLPVGLPGRPSRPLLIGGAVTSALSLAGAALVAWRLAHAQAGPMARAIRAAHPGRGRRGPSAARLLPPGLGGGLA